MAKTIYQLPGGGLRGDPPVQVAFSNGVKTSGGELLFISGQLGRDENNQIVGIGDIGAQTRQVMKNIKTIVENAGGAINDIVKVTVFITDMTLNTLTKISVAYSSFGTGCSKPSRKRKGNPHTASPNPFGPTIPSGSSVKSGSTCSAICGDRVISTKAGGRCLEGQDHQIPTSGSNGPW